MNNQLIGFAVGGTAPPEPHPANTKLLVHSDTTDGSTTFTDTSAGAHALTANGNAQHDTAQAYFGGSSMLFDGTGDYVSAADHADFEIGSGDFTIACWVRFNSFTNSPMIMGKWTATGNQRSWYFQVNSSADPATSITFRISTDGSTSAAVTETTSLNTGTWYHLAVTRTGGKIYLFVDGTLLGTGTANTDTVYDGTAILEVGSINAGTANNLDGWVDELIFVNGTGLWSASFTPPTTVYEDA